MKLEQLLFFSEAVKYNSISIAAEKNFISQPSFSASITKLEKELGITLLRRNNRGVTPTEVGEAVLEKAYQIFTAVEEIGDIAAQYNSQGTVNIAAIPCICEQVLPMALLKMRQHQSAITLSITTAESQEVYHKVLSGMSALGILIHSNEITSPEIRYTHLFDDEYLLYVGPASPYWDAPSITIAEALCQPYIAFKEEFIRNNGGVGDMLKGRTPNVALRTDDINSMKRIISEDNYVAFFYRMMTKDDVYQKYDLIRPIPISDYDTRLHIGYIESSKYKPTAADRLFIDILKSTVEEFFKPQ